MNGLNYKGTFDASLTTTPGGSPVAGDYYIINKAGTINTVSYAIGDWIVYNADDLDWQKISNSNDVLSVFGRSGKISAKEGDYILTKMGDVDLTTTPPVLNQYLKYNGTNWVAGSVSETDPTVLAHAKAVLPTCGAGQVLKSDGTSFSCVADATGGSSFSGTANRAVVTDGAGALAVSTITDTVLGYLSGTTSNIQTQLTARASTTDVTQTITALTVTGLTAPISAFDAVNKGYVDGFGQWQKGTNTADVVRATGNVGIGTTSPRGLIDVAGDTVAAAAGTHGSGIFLAGQNGGTGNTSGGSIFLNPGTKNGTGSPGIVGIGVTPAWVAANSWLGTNALFSTGYAYFAGGYVSGNDLGVNWGTSSTSMIGSGNSDSTDYFALSTQNKERLRINSSGNVGIGTTSPTSALNVVNGSIVSNSVTNTVAYIDFGAGNSQISSTAATTINLCGMKDGGTYTLLLTGIANGSNVTVNAYPTYDNTTSCSGAAISVDLGGGDTTFISSGNSNILSFVYFSSKGVYGIPAVNYNL